MVAAQTDRIQRSLSDYTGAFALYRLPDSAEAVCVRGDVAVGDVLPEKGFLVRPFELSEATPQVMILPECVEPFRVPDTPVCDLRPAFPVSEERGREAYAVSFSKCKEALVAGRVRKVVLSRRHTVEIPSGDLPFCIRLFVRACNLYPHHYVALWQTAQTGTWLVASPELLVALQEAEGFTQGSTMSLAGTLDATAGNLESLGVWDGKNREEQRLVTEYIAERLSTVCASVQTGVPRPVRSGNIAHLCTPITFRCPSPAFGPVAACLHPTPAVCGLPAAEARKVIVEAEKSPRRYYSGYSGPCRIDGGRTHLFVSLRCMELGRTTATLYAGGGLLPESREETEWEETRKKLASVIAILD